jgi:hypothetical protein
VSCTLGCVRNPTALSIRSAGGVNSSFRQENEKTTLTQRSWHHGRLKGALHGTVSVHSTAWNHLHAARITVVLCGIPALLKHLLVERHFVHGTTGPVAITAIPIAAVAHLNRSRGTSHAPKPSEEREIAHNSAGFCTVRSQAVGGARDASG